MGAGSWVLLGAAGCCWVPVLGDGQLVIVVAVVPWPGLALALALAPALGTNCDSRHDSETNRAA
jgi:hypothetical protein